MAVAGLLEVLCFAATSTTRTVALHGEPHAPLFDEREAPLEMHPLRQTVTAEGGSGATDRGLLFTLGGSDIPREQTAAWDTSNAFGAVAVGSPNSSIPQPRHTPSTYDLLPETHNESLRMQRGARGFPVGAERASHSQAQPSATVPAEHGDDLMCFCTKGAANFTGIPRTSPQSLIKVAAQATDLVSVDGHHSLKLHIPLSAAALQAGRDSHEAAVEAIEAAAPAHGSSLGTDAAAREGQHQLWQSRNADLELMTVGAPCAQDVESHEQHLGADLRALPWGDLPRFYMYEDGPFDLPAARCLLEFATNVSSASEPDLEAALHPELVAYASDVALLRLLRDHPSRVRKPNQALIHMIAAPVSTAALATSDFEAALQGKLRSGSPCGTMAEHYEKMASLSLALVQLPAWERCKGCDFFLPVTFRDPEAVLGPLLVNVLRDGPVMLGTSDAGLQAFDNSNLSSLRATTMVLPPKTSGSLSTNISLLETPPLLQGRTTSIMFHATANLSEEEMPHMHLMDSFSRFLANASIRDIGSTQDDMVLLRSALHSTLQEYGRSLFCFVPDLGSGMSHRLFDALSAGCVPIVMGDFYTVSKKLPFVGTVDWSRMALFAGTPKCIEDNFDSYAVWLLRLVLAGRPDAPTSSLGSAIFRMRDKGKRLFHKFFDFSSPNLVSAILRQANVTGHGIRNTSAQA